MSTLWACGKTRWFYEETMLYIDLQYIRWFDEETMLYIDLQYIRWFDEETMLFVKLLKPTTIMKMYLNYIRR